MDLLPTSILSAVSGIIVETDDFFRAVTSFRDVARVVLEGELHIFAQRKIAVLASKTPDYVAGCAVNLVDGVGVAGGDEV
jgi:hypothetical protein